MRIRKPKAGGAGEYEKINGAGQVLGSRKAAPTEAERTASCRKAKNKAATTMSEESRASLARDPIREEGLPGSVRAT